MWPLPCVRGHSINTRRVSEKVNLRILECGRLQDFEASGSRLARIAHGERYQAVLLACC
jgi:hypothetical protein